MSNDAKQCDGDGSGAAPTLSWTDLVNGEIEATYRATFGLIDLVEDEHLDWKPSTGSNWMTTGQLLAHITFACGLCCRGFVTGEWSAPEGLEHGESEDGEMLLPAEKLPSIASIDDARRRLAEDKALALRTVAEAGEDALATRMVAAPWNPTPRNLGQQFLDMVGHLESHKSQLFYYLKLLGKPVHTGHLWGMAGG